MYIFIIFIALILLFFFLNRWLNRLYQNPVRPNRTTPAQLGLAFEEVRIPTRRHRRLHGWWIPGNGKQPESALTLILVHGWGQNAEKMLPYVRELYPEGYNFLAFDARNHGESDSDNYATMLKFAEDILSVVAYLKETGKAGTGGIGVIGFSIGASASVYAASRAPEIKTVVAVGAFAHPAEVMRLDFKKWNLPYWLVSLIFKFLELKIGFTFNSIAPANNISRARASILLIHGEKDRQVPVEQARKLAAAGDPQKVQLRIMSGCGHQSCQRDPQFWQIIRDFLRHHFPVARPEQTAGNDVR